jgi:hypothetical protein
MLEGIASLVGTTLTASISRAVRLKSQGRSATEQIEACRHPKTCPSLPPLGGAVLPKIGSIRPIIPGFFMLIGDNHPPIELRDLVAMMAERGISMLLMAA